jgi:hypothetical protein
MGEWLDSLPEPLAAAIGGVSPIVLVIAVVGGLFLLAGRRNR